jgi:hypothetical protein
MYISYKIQLILLVILIINDILKLIINILRLNIENLESSLSTDKLKPRN